MGKWCNLTNIFQMGWNHQPDKVSNWNRSAFKQLTTNRSKATMELFEQFIATLAAEVTPKGSLVIKGILPKIAETFRLRIYNSLPRTIPTWWQFYLLSFAGVDCDWALATCKKHYFEHILETKTHTKHSMYGSTYMYHKKRPNLGKYTIHWDHWVSGIKNINYLEEVSVSGEFWSLGFFQKTNISCV